jgi:Spy/CpxP family protein refolding chaperone
VGRGIAIVLALSLAANVFLGGYVAGKLAGGHGGRDRHHVFVKHHDAMEGFSDMTPAARESLKSAFMAHRAESRERHRQTRALNAEFTAALGADQFDRAALDAIISKLDAVDLSGRTGMARLIVEAAEGLSAEDRKSLAKYLDKRGSRWKERRGHTKDAKADDPQSAPPTD